ncbi:hypothetical protein A2627_01985 [Candidatus Woesebacteria bacterium RIFCSPHIGHO2_01_FULL_39_28]|uniref:Glycosyl hydrolase family 13 catalytic domain-containing protein n=1 Tax=Candidatus Woesebacteria bacterium RIFCSPHIGHO2_01_FULL_39_28 TaxID=1802496 RepID=A0A1F7YKJ9_9BACT|nr:MAG: hypothetical protein A2627_01985 [Candidatus Woesebacteria bacterium RIFCSPHIGHO2_01_FULL_39_28]OGM56773.1 MAG: hypothetical protein A3A50_04180 [Candidatus Woesebacteria bacterium RIFCSPLOWO2_01_FULL_38_20]
MWRRLTKNLNEVYSKKDTLRTVKTLKSLSKSFKSKKNKSRKIHASSALIIYANSIEQNNINPLTVFYEFLKKFELNKVFELVHILPFYPWDTDRGFSVKDFYKVNPPYGVWKDIKVLSGAIPLMFDYVTNHASIDNPLVQQSLVGKKDHYKNFIITYSDENKPTDQILSKLTRPRPTPVLTPYYVTKNKNGSMKAYLGEPHDGWVWTTFARPKNPDGSEATKQVDLNFANPKVLVESLKILLFYIDHGASWIRLDAIGYIWKKLGSSSLHEPQAHTILAIISEFLGLVSPNTVTVSEINEPQEKAIEYLGKTQKEADYFYQFAHYPLSIYGILTGDIEPYKKWVKTLPDTQGRQFITVLGSHDGMGLKPVRSFLTQKKLDHMAKILTEKHGALTNYASLPGGNKIIYEICATPWNLINPPLMDAKNKTALNRYITVLASGLLQKGASAVYINGLLGSFNYLPKKEKLDENRTINREVFNKEKLFRELENKNSHTHIVFSKVCKLLKIRKSLDLFSPFLPNPLVIENNQKSVLTLLIKNKSGKDNLLSISNFSSKEKWVKVDVRIIKVNCNKFYDLITDRTFKLINKESTRIRMDPYQTVWLVGKSN